MSHSQSETPNHLDRSLWIQTSAFFNKEGTKRMKQELEKTEGRKKI